jgi:hypothetical protein
MLVREKHTEKERDVGAEREAKRKAESGSERGILPFLDLFQSRNSCEHMTNVMNIVNTDDDSG